MRASTYVLKVSGELEDEQIAELAGMTVAGSAERSLVLRGVVEDQAALAGLVLRLEMLGCSVQDVYRTATQPATVAVAVRGTSYAVAGVRWRIRVKGAMAPAVAKVVGDLEVTDVGLTTAVEAVTSGSQQLGALVQRLQALGLEIIEIHRCD